MWWKKAVGIFLSNNCDLKALSKVETQPSNIWESYSVITLVTQALSYQPCLRGLFQWDYQVQVSFICSSQAQLCALPVRKRPADSHLESLHFRIRKGSSGEEKLEAAMILQEQHLFIRSPLPSQSSRQE
jgi:hypothetical protein